MNGLRAAVILLAVVMSASIAVPTLSKFAALNMFGSDYFVIAKATGEYAEVAYGAANPPFAYPPTTKLFLWPLEYFQTTAGYIAFTTLTAGGFMLACRKYLGRTELALIPLSFPFINTALIGQPTFLVVALMLLGLSLKDRRLAGLVFAVAAATKPQIVALVPLYLLARRDWRAFLFAGGGYALAVMLSISLYSIWSWQEWPAAVANYRDVIVNGEVIRWVVTPIGMATRQGLPVWPVAIPCLIGAVALPFVKYRDPVEALFGLTLAALLILPFGCPDNMLGLVPLLVRRIASGRPVEALAYSLYIPAAAVLASFAALYSRGGGFIRMPARQISGKAPAVG